MARRVLTGTHLVALALLAVYARTAIATGYGIAPMDITPWVLIDHGAGVPATAIVLHAGLFHLVFSTVFVLMAGTMVEEHYGRWMMPPLFCATALAGSWLAIGASGGAMGLIGCLVGHGQRLAMTGDRRGERIRNEMLPFALLVLFLGFMVRADARAHLIGFLAGTLLGLVVRPDWVRGRVGAVLGGASLLAVFAAVAVATVPLSPG